MNNELNNINFANLSAFQFFKGIQRPLNASTMITPTVLDTKKNSNDEMRLRSEMTREDLQKAASLQLGSQHKFSSVIGFNDLSKDPNDYQSYKTFAVGNPSTQQSFVRKSCSHKSRELEFKPYMQERDNLGRLLGQPSKSIKSDLREIQGPKELVIED